MMFELDDLDETMVWKVVLPLGTKDPQLGKWSLTWE